MPTKAPNQTRNVGRHSGWVASQSLQLTTEQWLHTVGWLVCEAQTRPSFCCKHQLTSILRAFGRTIKDTK